MVGVGAVAAGVVVVAAVAGFLAEGAGAAASPEEAATVRAAVEVTDRAAG
jgi:hypothetical protein